MPSEPIAKIRMQRDREVGDVAVDLVAARSSQPGPNGITENVHSAVNAARNGEKM